MATDVKLNGQSLDPQPSRLIPHAPEPIRKQAINGLWLSFTPDFGWWFELVYGSGELVDADPITDFMNKISGGDTEELEYTDTVGNTVTKTVLWDQPVAPGIHWGDVTERFTIALYETTPEPGS